MDAEELALFRDAVTRAVEAQRGDALEAALEDLGWSDALEADPASAVSVLFECQGAAHTTSFALDRVLAGALGERGDPATSEAVVLPRLRQHGAPGHLHGDRCTVHGLGTAAMARAGRVLVVAQGPPDAGHVVAHLDVGTLELRPVRGLDPDLALVEVTGAFEAGAAVPVPEGDGWDGAVALGQLALGHELVGAARTMLDLARQHALGRIQFGRPIASFQAVRHRLAESLVAVESAAGLLAAAWEEPTPATAAMAKGFAGRSARTVAKHAQQVLAGLGFTTEHPLHEFVRRTLVLDQLLGAGSVLTKELGGEVLRTGSLPAALPL